MHHCCIRGCAKGQNVADMALATVAAYDSFSVSSGDVHWTVALSISATGSRPALMRSASRSVGCSLSQNVRTSSIVRFWSCTQIICDCKPTGPFIHHAGWFPRPWKAFDRQMWHRNEVNVPSSSMTVGYFAFGTNQTGCAGRVYCVLWNCPSSLRFLRWGEPVSAGWGREEFCLNGRAGRPQGLRCWSWVSHVCFVSWNSV